MANLPTYARGSAGTSVTYSLENKKSLYMGALMLPCDGVPADKYNDIMGPIQQHLAAKGFKMNEQSAQYNAITKRDGTLSGVVIGAYVPEGEKPEDFAKRLNTAVSEIITGGMDYRRHYQTSGEYHADWQRSYREVDAAKPACDLIGMNAIKQDRLALLPKHKPTI